MRRGTRAAVPWGLTGFVFVVALGAALSHASALPAAYVVKAGVRTANGDVALSVTTTDGLRFMPDSFTVPAGQPVSISVTQGGVILHTFTLLSLANYQAPPSTDNWTQLLHSHPALVNLVINATAGQTQTKTVASLKKGYYEFVCIEPGHFQAGMFGFIGVGGVAPPNAQVPTGAGAPVYYTTAVIAGLVVLMVILGVVFGRRARPAGAAPGYGSAPGPGPVGPETADSRNRL